MLNHKLYHLCRNSLNRAIQTLSLSIPKVELSRSHFHCLSNTNVQPVGRPPCLSVTPQKGLVDEKVQIQVSGLRPFESVILSAELEENKDAYKSHATYTADHAGLIDLDKDVSQSGSYTGVEPMGLFWGMSASHGQRLIKRNVETPWTVKIKVLPADGSDCTHLGVSPDTCLLETHVDRYYMKPGVTRIPITEGPFRGTIFVPEGNGPFPAVVDLFGALVSLVETRAALLASYGFATFSLSYMMIDHLPKRIDQLDLQYLLDAFDWYSQQPYVAKDRMGLVGLCFGGSLVVWTAAQDPRVKAVVNINGMPYEYVKLLQNDEVIPYCSGIDPKLVYATEEGVVLKKCFRLDPDYLIPGWRNGAKFLILLGGDDLMANGEFNSKFVEVCPKEYKQNIELVYYPGAGHIIEPPYIPHCRTVDKKGRLAQMGFIPERFHNHLLMCGGEPVQHAKAQVLGWEKVLNFLRNSL